MSYNLPLICTLVGIAGVVFSIITASVVKKAPSGNEKMNEIANAIKTGMVGSMLDPVFGRTDAQIYSQFSRHFPGCGSGKD